MDFILVAPDTLRGHWSAIRGSLEAVQAKAAEDWLIEDVYHAIKCGQVACHLMVKAGQYVGLFIIRPETAEFSGRQSLHIWIAHNAGDDDVFEQGEGLIKETARRMGVTTITFGSPRPGWAKRYRLTSATYEIAP
jgi:hypothetical protein